MKWDVFISHAREDKESVALPLAQALTARGLRVWLDRRELRLGDSLRAKVDEGLAESRFGVVVLSETFLKKQWPLWELNGLIAMERRGTPVILPVWHGLDHAALAERAPMLADRLAADTLDGIGP
ncbi:MAG: toll/interleukin-1 receptor domain-containing protein, partial [Actinomycetota bacterium]|nr:toll/interleukin-1 receptor domain-containing protein [Actinomycetota bacterium]